MNKRQGSILLLLTVLGLLLRGYGLGKESLYNDELYSWQQIDFPTYRDVMAKGIRPDVHPPGYLTLLYLTRRALGDSETMLRLPSALAGTLWIPAMFLLGRRLFGPEEGLIAAALVAVAWAPIYFSQEARAYAFLVLLVILSAYAWTGVVRDKNPRAAVGYALAAAGTLYVHPFGVVFVPLAGAAMVLACLRDRRMLVVSALAQLAVVVMYLPWLGEFIRDARTAGFALDRPGLRHVARVFGYMFNRSLALTAIAAVLYAEWIYHAVRKGITRTEGMLVLWAIVPIALVVAKSLVSEPILTNRNMLICLPPLYLLLARSVATLPVTPRWRECVAAALVVVFLAQLVFVERYYDRPHKTQFREAVRFVVDHDRGYPDAAIVGWAWYRRQFDYYFEHLGSDRRVDAMGNLPEHLAGVRAYLASHRPRHVWFLYAHRPPDERFVRFFDERYDLIAEQRYIKAGVRLYRARPEATRPGPTSTCSSVRESL